MTVQNTKVIVPCRLSYAHIWEPDSVNGSEPKYSVSCIIDKDDKETIAKIKKSPAKLAIRNMVDWNKILKAA